MSTLIYIGIYLAGYVCSYYEMRYFMRKKFIERYWIDIIEGLILSLPSWISVIVMPIVFFLGKLKFPKNPPRWL
jgi:hypothetical protein